MNRLHRCTPILVLLFALATLSSCSSSGGWTRNTRAGDALREEWLIGRWDADGERTNEGNGFDGVKAAASNLWNELFGRSWRMEAGGVLLFGGRFSTKQGTWRLEGADRLILEETRGGKRHTFLCQFRDGYLYLKRTDNRFLVMGRGKFLGL